MLRLGYQGKFDSMLKTVTNDICEVKTKFTALESELHINKTVTNNFSKYIKTLERNAMKMSIVQIGSIWRYQAFLVVSVAMLWKKLTETFFKS